MGKEAAEGKPKITTRIIEYFKDTRGEVRKVNWPTRQQLIRLTLVVLAVTAAMAIFLWAVDLLFSTLVQLII